MLRTERIIAGAASLAVLAGSIAAAAETGRQWQMSAHYWEGGDTQALLVFGTPNSDDVVISAECSSEDPGRIVMDLLIDLGPNAPGAQTSAHFDVGGVLYHFRATTHDSEVAPYGRVALEVDDPLWSALQTGEPGDVSLFYAEATTFNGDGADTAVSDFLAECSAIEVENPR